MLNTKGIESSIDISYLDALFIVLFPIIGSILAVVLLFFGYGGWFEVGVFLLMYSVTMIGVEVGFHRYFTHKSFATSKFFEILLAVLGSMSGQGGVLWWAAVHRNHHRYSDKDLDPHLSANSKFRTTKFNQFFFAHFGWLFNRDKTWSDGGWLAFVKDWKSKEYLARIQVHYKSWFVVGLIIPSVIGGIYHQSFMGFLLGFLWGGTFRLLISLHSFWAINSVCHSFGTQPFETKDESRNNILVAILTFGQGWHNNHHAFPKSSYLNFKWWQIDIGGFFIKLLCKFNLAWNDTSYEKRKIDKRRKNVAGKA